MAITKLKRSFILNAKNLVGWRTDRKIVVLSVDDYGNVRLDSKKAREKLDQEGLKVLSPFSGFDLYDSLENKADLEMLFETLSSVVDGNGRHAVLTPFAVPCNIDFERVKESGFSQYYYELLPDTYSKLSSLQPSGYKGAWRLWKEGISKGLMKPQFHGREHLNLNLFNEKLERNETELITALDNRSFARIPSNNKKNISVSAAFDFWESRENKSYENIIIEGLEAFNTVFGYNSNYFNPPAGSVHPVVYKFLKDNGVKYLDTPLIKNEHQGKGKYKKVFNYTGKQNQHGQTFLVRNVVFEPTDDRGVDWVSFAMKQIEAAFRWKRPAIISSHRVNFCGHIDESNRKKGLNALKNLLKQITERWPEVEFMAADELGDLITSD